MFIENFLFSSPRGTLYDYFIIISIFQIGKLSNLTKIIQLKETLKLGLWDFQAQSPCAL